MTRAVFSPIIGPEFDPFLFAPITADRNGTPVSVLSAFARTDMDPWQEAACLARMSRETATTRLAAFIVAMPDSGSADTPADTVARNLVDLLPLKSVLRGPITLPAVLPRDNLGFGLMISTIALLVAIALMLWSNSVSQPLLGARIAAPIEHGSPPDPALTP